MVADVTYGDLDETSTARRLSHIYKLCMENLGKPMKNTLYAERPRTWTPKKTNHKGTEGKESDPTYDATAWGRWLGRLYGRNCFVENRRKTEQFQDKKN